ncbi:MAG TPA: hypothetical protein VKA08_05010 [Balneolales bacterium]|nr:hypothetical protein [Balneolales bacterium]
MIRRKGYFLLKLVVPLFILLGCNLESGESPTYQKPFTFKYIESGGIMGMNNILSYTVGDSLVYESRNFHVAKVLSAGEKQSLIALLDTRHFFRMEPSYLPPKGIADDNYYTLSYDSPSQSKKVVVSASCGTLVNGCAWPDGFKTIMTFMQQQVAQLKDATTTGCVRIKKTYHVSPWPYEDQVVLGNSLYETLEISDTIVQTLQTAQDTTPRTLFYEGDWIYSLAFNLHDASMSITDRTHPIYWSIVPFLANIPEQGVVIKGSDYTWLDSVLTHPHYPWYFTDQGLANGNSAYELDFVRGNACQ